MIFGRPILGGDDPKDPPNPVPITPIPTWALGTFTDNYRTIILRADGTGTYTDPNGTANLSVNGTVLTDWVGNTYNITQITNGIRTTSTGGGTSTDYHLVTPPPPPPTGGGGNPIDTGGGDPQHPIDANGNPVNPTTTNPTGTPTGIPITVVVNGQSIVVDSGSGQPLSLLDQGIYYAKQNPILAIGGIALVAYLLLGKK